VFQIALRKGYGIPDLKTDLALLYSKTGVKNIGMVFLMTDAQVDFCKYYRLVHQCERDFLKFSSSMGTSVCISPKLDIPVNWSPAQHSVFSHHSTINYE
jgi:hypothetical protein